MPTELRLRRQNAETRLRKLKIIEHISLDGVIRHTADDDNFPYIDWNARYSAPAGRDALCGACGESFGVLLCRPAYDIQAKGAEQSKWRTLSESGNKI